MGTGVSKKLKNRVFKRDRGLCFYCGCAVTHNDPERTLDHVIPKSKGGSNRMWNLVLSCKSCNKKKGDNDPAPELLALVFKRRDLAELMILIGKHIERKKCSGERSAVPGLIQMQVAIQEVLMGTREEATIRFALDTAVNLVENFQKAA